MSDIELLQVDHIDWPNAVISAALTAPPGSPTLGDRYIVAGSPTGAWSGHATHIARWNGSAWQFQTPTAGRLAYNEATSGHVRFDGSAWSPFTTSGTLQNAYDAGATISLSATDLVTSDGSVEVLRLGSTTKLAAPTQPTTNTTGYALTITGSTGGAAASAGIPGDGGTVTIVAGVMGSESASPGSAVGGVAGNHLILRGGDGGNVSGAKSGSVFIDGGQIGTGAAGGTPVPGDVKIGTNANQTYAVRMGQSTTGTPVEVKGPIWTPLTTLTDAATVTVTIAKGNAFKVVLGGNRTLDFSFPTNYSNSTVDITGHTGQLIVQQDATGGRTLSFAAKVKTTGDVTLNSSASAYTVFEFCVETTSIVHLRKVEASSSSVSLTSNAPANVTATTAAVGTGTAAARDDHKHNISTGAPATLVVGGSNTTGVATSLALSDHVHALPAFGTTSGTFMQGNQAAGGDTTGTLNSLTVTQSRGLKSATTTVDVSTATAPTTGQVLTATGASAATWQTPSGSTTANAIASATTTVNVSAATAPSTGQVLTATDSTHAVWSAPTGGAASDLATTGANVNVSAAAPPSTGKVLTATDATHATWQTPTAGASNPFVDAPGSPHSDNDEFTTWSGWTVYDVTASANLTDDGDGSIDPWTFPASGHYRRKTVGSYIMLQFPKSTNNIIVYKAITPASNMLLWSRFQSGANFNSSGTNSFQSVGFGVFQDNSGRPKNATDGFTVGGSTNPSNVGRNMFAIQQGGTQNNSITLGQGVAVPDIVGVFEQSSTSRYIFLVDSKCGDVQVDDLSPRTGSRTTVYAGWRVVPTGASATNGMCPILVIDYFRRKDSSTAWIV